MIYRVEVSTKDPAGDVRGQHVVSQAALLGIPGVARVRVSDLYFLQGELDDDGVRRLAAELLVDPVVDEVRIGRPDEAPAAPPGAVAVEVAWLPGVTDSVAESLVAGARTAGLGELETAATAQRYVVHGALDADGARRLAEGLLANRVVQYFAVDRPVEPAFVTARAVDETVDVIPLSDADDEELLRISAERRLSLDLAEMRAIRAYFRTAGREATDVELEMLAQTWSEHCVHKTFRARITYEERGRPTRDGDADPAVRREVVDGLLKTYIRGATEKAAKGDWIRSAFVDNAGIVGFDDRLDLAFKVETHNHPSALEPFGGANTGVGGVVRDVIGVSARPIANTDVLCFGPEDLPFDELPAGVLHPRRVADGVVHGIEDYGNKMGIPTVSGAIVHDPGYTANPLVYCGCLGVLPHGSHPRAAKPGDRIVVLGGRTGRDGLRGATFSSMEMDHQTGEVAGSAVQIGHPIHEKQTLDVILEARDAGLYDAITDCGAGGLSSAVGEMAEGLGADVHLDRVPLKYAGLRPWEIWLSEAQERMVLSVPPESWGALERICERHDVEATDLGVFTDTGEIVLRHGGRVVGALALGLLHAGIPRRELRAVWTPPETAEPRLAAAERPGALADGLLALLRTPGIRSNEHVVRRFDHEVQGGTVVKPYTGPAGVGPTGAAVLVPLDAQRRAAPANGADGAVRGVALSVGVNPFYGAIDPYAMAWAAVDEALRNVVAVGGDPTQVALLDNFCWGNPNLPDRLGGLVRCARGCHDAAVAFGAPFVSGKDSLNNEYTGQDGRKHAIPGTILVSALAIVPDVARTVTSELKATGDHLYVVGQTRDELGASAWYRLHGELGAHVPRPPAAAPALYRALHGAIRAGLVRSCQDCAEGGVLVAAAEMAIGAAAGPAGAAGAAAKCNELGLKLRLGALPCDGPVPDAARAFGESLGRFLVAVDPEDAPAFERHLAGHPCARVGTVRDDGRFRVRGADGEFCVDLPVAALAEAWRGHVG
jgi:phosphoribosylformylglycinamidine synthase